MMSNPKRTLLAGLLLGALVIGAAVMPSREDKLPGTQSGSERDVAAISGELDNGSVEAQRSNSSSASSHSDDISHIFQAIQESLKRNDLASAKVLLGAVQTLRKDDSRALTLQKELQAREEQADAVPPDAPPDDSRITAKSNRSAARAPARIKRSHEGAPPAHEHAIGAPRQSRAMDAPKTKTPSQSALDAQAVRPDLGAGSTASRSPEGVPTVSGTPPRPALIHAIPPIKEVLPPVQVAAPKQLAVQSDQAPKTRAQVRAELDRARADGSLPRFGNPDPAGPGGVPSSTKKEFDSE